VTALSTEGLRKAGTSLFEHRIPGGDLTERIDEQIRNLGGKVKGLEGLGAQVSRLRQLGRKYLFFFIQTPNFVMPILFNCNKNEYPFNLLFYTF
jgi:hypothetical protein